jgi:hypothetical protein
LEIFLESFSSSDILYFLTTDITLTQVYYLFYIRIDGSNNIKSVVDFETREYPVSFSRGITGAKDGSNIYLYLTSQLNGCSF